MIRGLILACAALSLAACATTANAPHPGGSGGSSVPAEQPGLQLPTPAEVTRADSTTLDERAGTAITLAYTAAARLAIVSIQTGLVKDPATIRRIGELDNRAKAAVDAVRATYFVGNARSYSNALEQARIALGELNSALGAKP